MRFGFSRQLFVDKHAFVYDTESVGHVGRDNHAEFFCNPDRFYGSQVAKAWGTDTNMRGGYGPVPPGAAFVLLGVSFSQANGRPHQDQKIPEEPWSALRLNGYLTGPAGRLKPLGRG